MGLRTGLLNGKTIQQDYDLSKLVLNLLQGSNSSYRGNILEGLGVSYDLGTTTLTVGQGTALIKCERTGNDNNVLATLLLSADDVSTVSAPFKVWIETKQTHIDDGLLHNTNGDNISEIKTGTSYPTNNYLPLAEISAGGVVTTITSILGSIDDSIQQVIALISGGNTTLGDIIANSITLPGGDVQTQINNILSSGVPTESLVDLDTYLAGEKLLPGESHFAEVDIAFSEADTWYNVGDTVDNTRVFIPLVGTGVPGNTVAVATKKIVSPSVDLSVRLEVDNNQQPTGALIAPGASGSIVPASVPATATNTQITISGGTVSDGHGVTLNSNQLSHTQHEGVKFTFTGQSSIVSVTKVAACTATKAYLYNSEGVLLQTATFSSNVATFNNSSIVNGQSYIVLCGSDGASYTSVKQTGGVSFPYSASRLDFDAGFYAGPVNTDSLAVSGLFGAVGPSTPSFSFQVTSKCLLDAVANVGLNARIYDGLTLLETGVLGTFSGTLTLVPGILYTVNYVGYTTVNNYTTATFPEVDTNVTFISCRGGRWDAPSHKFAASVTTREMYEDLSNIYNIVSVNVQDNILIGKGVRYHAVFFQGTYGSETINATNYYQLGYKAKNTTTREGGKYDGSGYSKLGGPNVTDTSIVFNGGNVTTGKTGFRCQAGQNITIKEVNKDAGDTSTICYIENDAGVVIESVAFSGNTAVFSGNTKITAGTFFRIESDANGASCTKRLRTNSRSPTGTNVIFSQGCTGATNNGNGPNAGQSIASVKTQVYIPDSFFFLSSNMATRTLLSKTDGRYSYKLPTDKVRIALLPANIGETCISVTFGKCSIFTSLTPLLRYWVANVPGMISTIPGTNKFLLGQAIDDKCLFVGSELGSADTVPTTLNISISGGATGTNTSGIFKAVSNGSLIYSHYSASGNGGLAEATYQRSDDGITFTNIGTSGMTGPSGAGVPSSRQCVPIPMIKGKYYRNTVTNTFANASAASVLTLTAMTSSI